MIGTSKGGVRETHGDTTLEDVEVVLISSSSIALILVLVPTSTTPVSKTSMMT